MTPEEVAKKHCYNGHNPEMCSLLADLRSLVSQEREQVAAYLESAAPGEDVTLRAGAVFNLAAAVRSGVHANVTKV